MGFPTRNPKKNKRLTSLRDRLPQYRIYPILFPLATALSGRLTTLEKRLKSGPDISVIQKRYDTIATDLKIPSDQLDGLKNAKDYRFNKLTEMRRIVRRKNRLFEEISEPILLTIRQLGVWRKEWLKEKKDWNEWEPSFLAGGIFEQLKPSFEKANDTIDTALNLIIPRLEALLRVQERAGHTKAKIDVLTAELDDLIMEKRQGALSKASPPMFSSEYFSQFRGGIWVAVKKGLDEISWPESRIFAQHGWIILMQGIFSIFMIISVYRNRRVLTESKKWFFLAARPFDDLGRLRQPGSGDEGSVVRGV